MGVIKRLYTNWMIKNQEEEQVEEDAPKRRTPEELIVDQVEGLKFMMRNQQKGRGHGKGNGKGKGQDQGRG